MAQYLRAIDLASDYHLIKLTDKNCRKTMFISRYGLFYYAVLPLDLCNALNTFQCFVSFVMQGYINKLVLVYLDDILVYNDTIKWHEEHVYQVLSRLCEYKLQAYLKKYELVSHVLSILVK